MMYINQSHFIRISGFVLSFFILSMGVLSGQEDQQEKDNKNAPVMEFEKELHDYGTISKGGNGTYEFVFTNKGKEPLIVSNVRSSCGCTTPKWTKEPVKKRKQGSIAVKYNTRIVGNFRKSITVYSNAKNSPVRLTITGKVVQEEEKQQ